jgi:pimeloyl-ACP methyl ester carboxylesterase
MPAQSVNGIEIHYDLTGSGRRTCLFIHGSGGRGASWIRQLERLADAARVVALDLPGHGQSGGEGYSVIEDYARMVRDFVEAAKLGKVVLGGHSMGGAVAQAFALAYPERLDGLILVGTGARLRVLPKIFELLRADYPEGVRFINGRAFSRSTAQRLKDAARARALETRPQVTIGDYTACNGFDVMERIGALRIPTLVIGGEDDQLTPPKYARYLARTIPGAVLVMVEQAGHYVHLEQPEVVNQAIRDFLTTLAAR